MAGATSNWCSTKDGNLMSDPLEGPRWPTNVVTYSFASTNYVAQPASFSHFITNPAYQAIVESAAAAWSAVSGIQFQLVPDSASVDIRVGFQSLDATPGGVIGSAYWSWSGPNFLPGTIVAAEDPAANLLTPLPNGDFQYSGTTTGLRQVFEHELGHALGLDHNQNDLNAAMYPNSGPSNNSGPDLSDIQAIQSLYGAPASSPTFIYDANATVVREDYAAGLGREPDQDGWAHWDDFLNGGGTPAQLAENISQLLDFQALHAQQTDADYVESLYENGLGRSADSGGLQGWVGALQRGSLDRAGVLAGIVQSPESHAHLQLV
jgi:predicted Zn-dependent protease